MNKGKKTFYQLLRETKARRSSKRSYWWLKGGWEEVDRWQFLEEHLDLLGTALDSGDLDSARQAFGDMKDWYLQQPETVAQQMALSNATVDGSSSSLYAGYDRYGNPKSRASRELDQKINHLAYLLKAKGTLTQQEIDTWHADLQRLNNPYQTAQEELTRRHTSTGGGVLDVSEERSTKDVVAAKAAAKAMAERLGIL